MMCDWLQTFDNIMELLKSVKAREEGRAVNTTMTDAQKQPKQVRLFSIEVYGLCDNHHY